MKNLLIIIAAIGLTGCSSDNNSALEKWEGEEVTVQFRRDFLGSSGSPIAPTSTWLNNTLLSLNGEITEASREGIFLHARYKLNAGDAQPKESEIWIPAGSILMIEKAK